MAIHIEPESKFAAMPAEKPFFQLRNVRKVYQTGVVETTALADISLDIREGEFVCVMGPSGCGKTTLLNVVAMLDTPSQCLGESHS